MNGVPEVRRFGLLGRDIQYSKSPEIWQTIWERQGVRDCTFELIDTTDPLAILEDIKSYPTWRGLMVTTPYKEMVMTYLDDLSNSTKKVGAVNAININEGKLTGHNTDLFGFVHSIKPLKVRGQALVLGSGGASKAVQAGLSEMGIGHIVVSRSPHGDMIPYEAVTPDLLRSFSLIINATPLGGPKMPDTPPPIPYHALTASHILYDLSYIDEVTAFLKAAPIYCTKINGAAMLQLQAEEAWRIFLDQEK